MNISQYLWVGKGITDGGDTGILQYDGFNYDDGVTKLNVCIGDDLFLKTEDEDRKWVVKCLSFHEDRKRRKFFRLMWYYRKDELTKKIFGCISNKLPGESLHSSEYFLREDWIERQDVRTIIGKAKVFHESSYLDTFPDAILCRYKINFTSLSITPISHDAKGITTARPLDISPPSNLMDASSGHNSLALPSVLNSVAVVSLLPNESGLLIIVLMVTLLTAFSMKLQEEGVVHDLLCGHEQLEQIMCTDESTLGNGQKMNLALKTPPITRSLRSNAIVQKFIRIGDEFQAIIPEHLLLSDDSSGHNRTYSIPEAELPTGSTSDLSSSVDVTSSTLLADEFSLLYYIFCDDADSDKKLFVADIKYSENFGRWCCHCCVVPDSLESLKSDSIHNLRNRNFEDDDVIECDLVFHRIQDYILKHPWGVHRVGTSPKYLTDVSDQPPVVAFKTASADLRPIASDVDITVSELQAMINDGSNESRSEVSHQELCCWEPYSTKLFSTKEGYGNTLALREIDSFMSGCRMLRPPPPLGSLLFVDLFQLTSYKRQNPFRYLFTCAVEGPRVSSTVREVNRITVFDGKKTFTVDLAVILPLDSLSDEEFALKALYKSDFNFMKAKQTVEDRYQQQNMANTVFGVSVDDLSKIISIFISNRSSDLLAREGDEVDEVDMIRASRALKKKIPTKTLVTIYKTMFPIITRVGMRAFKAIMAKASQLLGAVVPDDVFPSEINRSHSMKHVKFHRNASIPAETCEIAADNITGKKRQKSSFGWLASKLKRAKQAQTNDESSDSDSSSEVVCSVCGMEELDEWQDSLIDATRRTTGDGLEELLIICDRCDRAFHPVCVGLARIPEGDWFCVSCSMQPEAGDTNGCNSVPASEARTDRVIVTKYVGTSQRKGKKNIGQCISYGMEISSDDRHFINDRHGDARQKSVLRQSSVSLIQDVLQRRQILTTINLFAIVANNFPRNVYEKCVMLFTKKFSPSPSDVHVPVGTVSYNKDVEVKEIFDLLRPCPSAIEELLKFFSI